jgi:hypothetical protein
LWSAFQIPFYQWKFIGVCNGGFRAKLNRITIEKQKVKMLMRIMVTGPYRSGVVDAAVRAENLRLLNQAALAVFRRGHIPVIGVNLALPIIEAAGPDSYDEIMMRLSLAAAERCNAMLRIGGQSGGADDEVARFRARGLQVFHALDEIPEAR